MKEVKKNNLNIEVNNETESGISISKMLGSIL